MAVPSCRDASSSPFRGTPVRKSDFGAGTGLDWIKANERIVVRLPTGRARRLNEALAKIELQLPPDDIATKQREPAPDRPADRRPLRVAGSDQCHGTAERVKSFGRR